MLFIISLKGRKGDNMKKYLLLVEDETLWQRFKSSIDKDINTEIMDLIKKKLKKGEKSNEK